MRTLTVARRHRDALLLLAGLLALLLAAAPALAQAMPSPATPAPRSAWRRFLDAFSAGVAK